MVEFLFLIILVMLKVTEDLKIKNLAYNNNLLVVFEYDFKSLNFGHHTRETSSALNFKPYLVAQR